jgi:hypothetical protein
VHIRRKRLLIRSQSLINDTRIDEHQAHPVEQLDARSVGGGGETLLARLDHFPIAAKLIVANAPGARIELGWLVLSQYGSRAIAIESNSGRAELRQ